MNKSNTLSTSQNSRFTSSIFLSAHLVMLPLGIRFTVYNETLKMQKITDISLQNEFRMYFFPFLIPRFFFLLPLSHSHLQHQMGENHEICACYCVNMRAI